MSYLGIGSPIPVGRIVSSDSVLLSYPSDESCQIGSSSTITPSQALPAGGTFTSVGDTLGSSLDSSNGSITLNSSTPTGDHVIKYEVGTAFATFSLKIKVMEDATFTYSGTGSNPILISAGSGNLSPTETSSYNTDTYTHTPPSDYINPQGVIDTDNLAIGVVYDITRITGGDCSQSSTVKVQAQATSIGLVDNNFAIEFDGVDQYVSAGYSSAFNDITSGSWQFWVKTNNNEADYKPIFCKDNSTGNRPFLIAMHTGKLRVYLHPNGSSYTYVNNPTNITISDGEWNHIVVTYNGTDTVKIYKNGGSPVFTKTNLAGTGGLVNNLQVQTILGRLDTNMAGSTWEYFEGDLDEVAFWKRELSQNEIQLIYNATINNPGKTANLFTSGEGNSLVYWNRMGD